MFYYFCKHSKCSILRTNYLIPVGVSPTESLNNTLIENAQKQDYIHYYIYFWPGLILLGRIIYTNVGKLTAWCIGTIFLEKYFQLYKLTNHLNWYTLLLLFFCCCCYFTKWRLATLTIFLCIGTIFQENIFSKYSK